MQEPRDRLTLRMGSGGISEFDDPELARLDAQEQQFARELGLMGPEVVAPAEPGEVRPFDLMPARPRAIPLERLYAAMGQKLPADVLVLADQRAPLLIYQGLTPFNPPGRAPASVWGMGYEILMQSPQAETLSVQPSTELLEVATLNQDVELSLSAGGKFELPQQATAVLNAIPGVALEGVKIGASMDQGFRLGIQFRFELLKVQAGHDGAGGARWNLYRQDDRLDGFQPLLHTVLVPRGTKTLQCVVRTWVVRAGGWFGLKKSVKWESSPVPVEVPVFGLD